MRTHEFVPSRKQALSHVRVPVRNRSHCLVNPLNGHLPREALPAVPTPRDPASRNANVRHHLAHSGRGAEAAVAPEPANAPLLDDVRLRAAVLQALVVILVVLGRAGLRHLRRLPDRADRDVRDQVGRVLHQLRTRERRLLQRRRFDHEGASVLSADSYGTWDKLGPGPPPPARVGRALAVAARATAVPGASCPAFIERRPVERPADQSFEPV